MTKAVTLAGLGSTNPNLTAPIVDSLNGGQLAGMRNRIINGDMRVAQRTATAIVANTFTYGGVDRILWSINGTITAGTVSQIGGTSAGVSGYSSALALFSGTSITAAYTQTRIEAKDAINLNSKTITVSCKVFQDTGVAINVTPYIAKPPTTADTFTNSPSLIASATAVSIPSGVLTTISTTYTLGATDASLGIAPSLVWSLSGTYTSKYLTVTDWQLEIGSVATPFEQRPYGMELALCQRYYQNVPFAATCCAASTTTVYLALTFNMRSVVAIGTPSAAITINNPALGNFTQSAANATFAAAGTSTGCLVSLANFTGLTVGNSMFINTGNLIPISAEL